MTAPVIPMPVRVPRPRPTMEDHMRRTADALRAGDIVELFPGTPLLVLSVHPDPEAPGCWKVIVLGAEKEWAIQSVPPETWYVVLSRGPLGRASDRITQLLRLAGRK